MTEPATEIMPELSHCAECGAVLPPDKPKGLCPQCALTGALELTQVPRNRPGHDPLPRDFGDYELLEEIAHGGMGVIYKARQKSLGRIVALKMLLFGQRASTDLIRRFKTEAVAAGSLQHPNIVAVHEVGIHEGQHFIVMDYVKGPNLATVAKKASVSCVHAGQYLKTIAEAIHYAHEHRVLHRDLKPSNVLIDENDQPRVTDFGLAKALGASSFEGAGDETNSNDAVYDEATADGNVVGSPGYMSPEQAAGKRNLIGRCSDVYSLGAMLYHLLTGRPPFKGKSVGDTIHQVVTADPILPHLLNPAIPRDLETICLKCLDKEPRRRYATARELAEDLDRFLSKKPIHARPAGPWLRLNRWVQRNPVGATLILCLFLGLSVSFVLLKLLLDQRKAKDSAEEQRRLAEVLIWQTIGVSGFWDKPDPAVRIPAEVLSLAAGGPTVQGLDPSTQRVTLGLLAEENPARLAVGYAVLLHHVEGHLNAGRMQQVRFEIVLFKQYDEAKKAFARGELDLLRIGGNAYLQVKELDPGILPIVSQHPAKLGVIFTRKDSNIHRLEDIRGHSLILGDQYSTISARALFHLAEAGITPSNLVRYVFFDSIGYYASNSAVRTPDVQLTSHTFVIEAVRTNGFDVGIASESQFRQEIEAAGLVPLKVFPSDPVFWAVRSGFPSALASDLRQALVGLRDPEIFRGISRRITHYLPASDADLDDLRKAMALVQSQYGGGYEKGE